MKCDHCGYIEGNLSVEYYHRYGCNLCDRCIDKHNSVANGRDVDEYWTDEDAAKDGLCEFPFPTKPIIEKNLKEEIEERKRKYEKI